MPVVALIGCGLAKLERPALARDMYVGSLFKARLQYAQALRAEETCILSAKFGLLDLRTVIQPYNVTLKQAQHVETQRWGVRVASQVVARFSPDTTLVALVASRYAVFVEHVPNRVVLPTAGLRMGERIRYLKLFTDLEKWRNT